LAFGVQFMARDHVISYFPFHISEVTSIGGQEYAFIVFGFGFIGNQAHVISGGEEYFFGLFGPGGVIASGFEDGGASEGDGVPSP
ncbi:MAG: hypothetical protein KF721_16035, partial [Ignavibacteriaceae bacterium]|nr:hypothetical protein [Ignavibacteriaceae bacterium]